MPYQRPTNHSPLSKPEKLSPLAYIEHYRQLAAADASVLNRKVPREAFGELIDRLGEMLLVKSARMAGVRRPRAPVPGCQPVAAGDGEPPASGISRLLPGVEFPETVGSR
jgi:hypothetical protein